jgi:tetratricopeptide (TPR) repeat protein
LLAGVGHELASREEVAHFVGRLSGQRFDRRSAAVRSKSLPQLETTLKWPIELPTTNGSSRRGARPATSSSAGVETPRTESQSVPVEPPTPRAFEPPAEVVEPALSLLPAHPALWKTQIAEAAPATPARAPRPAGGRTVSGIGTPAHSVLTPSLPFSHLTPAPFAPKWQSSPPSAMHIGPAETRARDSQPPTPQSSASNLPSFTEAEPILRAPVRYSRAPASSAPRVGGLARARVQAQQLWRRATASVPSAFSRPRVWLGVLGAVLALGSASSVVLALRGPGADAKTLNAATPTPVQAEPPAVTTEASTAWVALPSREPSRPGPAADEPDAAATSQRASPPTEAPDTEAPDTEKVSTDIHATRLGDPQLVELFELEHRRELPSCSARLAASGFDYPGIRPKAAVLALKAARQQMMRGKTDAAYLALCRATALNPAHTGAQQTLAELALQLGDPAGAKAAAEEALLAAPADPELLGVLGDAVALAGDIAESRRIWLRTLPDKGTEAERLRRLASSYRGIGARALSRSHWAQARSYYRRALIASAGGVTASLGLSEALIRLKHMRAGLVWAERAAHAFPRDSRAQLLLGDALYGNGQREAARAAWRKALQVQPKNRMAARRLRQGKP